MKQLKPRDKITQKMTRDGAVEINETQQTAERISSREADSDFSQPDTATAERVMEHLDAAHTRKARKKAVKKAHEASVLRTSTSRLQFTDDERETPKLQPYIKKSEKAADKLDAAKAALPKQKKLVKERTFEETTGKAKTRLRFEEQEKPIPGGKAHSNPLSHPAQEAGIFVHNKIHSVEKDNSGVEGAHKSEELAERGARYGTRKLKQGYRSHKLKPYWSWYGFNSRVEWCACFVSWCYNQAGKSEPRFAGCEWQGVPWFQSRGQWGARGYENIAPGDAIFFDWDLDGVADHVGLTIL